MDHAARPAGALASRRTWDRLLAPAQTNSDAVGELVWVVSVDATISRAHQHAAGARKQPAKAGPYDKRAANYRAAVVLASLVWWLGP